MGELLSKILGSGSKQKPEEKVEITCEKCGMTYEEFKKTGRLGCANCYEAFGEQINSMLEGIHGHAHHVGKAPEYLEQELRFKQKLRDLRHRMEEAISTENFEEAAALRDEIRALEKQQEEALSTVPAAGEKENTVSGEEEGCE